MALFGVMLSVQQFLDGTFQKTVWLTAAKQHCVNFLKFRVHHLVETFCDIIVVTKRVSKVSFFVQRNST